jgi:hypothetical protein
LKKTGKMNHKRGSAAVPAVANAMIQVDKNRKEEY